MLHLLCDTAVPETRIETRLGTYLLRFILFLKLQVPVLSKVPFLRGRLGHVFCLPAECCFLEPA